MRPAHAQAAGGGPTQSNLDVGVVDGLTITTSVDGPNGVTTPVNTDATFTATASAGTPRFVGVTPGWTIVGGASYKWSIDGAATGGGGQTAAARSAASRGAQPAAAPADPPPTLPITYSPTNTAKTTVTIPGASPARTDGYVVTITCGVTYSALGPDGKQPGYLTSSVSKTIKVYLIGGPISGTNDIYWFRDPDKSTDWGHLSAASGQPDGTTYSWSIAGNARFVGDPPTTATAAYCGSGSGSKDIGDVKATVTYSLNNVTATSDPYSITVHAPMYFVLNKPSTDAYTKYEGPGPDDTWGFQNEHLYFTIWDGLKQPMSSSKHQAYWDETWTGDEVGPAQIGLPLDLNGSSFDTFSFYGPPVSQPTNANGDKTRGPFTHSYNVTDDGGGASGAGVGSFVKSYSNVTYTTYGMVGNDLPAPTK